MPNRQRISSILSSDATRTALLGILVLAFFLRVFHASTDMHDDEGFTCSMVLQDFAGIMRQTFALSEPHPVGYYFLIKAWKYLGGETEFAQRFPSLLFGVLAV